MFANGEELCTFDKDIKAFRIDLQASEEYADELFEIEIYNFRNPSTTREMEWTLEMYKNGKLYSISET